MVRVTLRSTSHVPVEVAHLLWDSKDMPALMANN